MVLAAVTAGVVALFALLVARSPLTFSLAGAVAIGLATAAWRRRPREGVSHWQAQERNVREGRMIVYWRPGCPSCYRLRLALGRRARLASWVDIWADDEAAAFVRDVNAGPETVPTVILGDGSALTNPAAQVVAEQLTG